MGTEEEGRKSAGPRNVLEVVKMNGRPLDDYRCVIGEAWTT